MRLQVISCAMSSDSILATDLDIKPDTVYAYMSFFLSLITCWILTLIIISSVTFACYSFHRVEKQIFCQTTILQCTHASTTDAIWNLWACSMEWVNGKKNSKCHSDTKCSFPKFLKLLIGYRSQLPCKNLYVLYMYCRCREQFSKNMQNNVHQLMPFLSKPASENSRA